MSINLPREFLTRMECLLGEDYLAFLASYDDPPEVGLRVNSAKVSPQEFVTLFPYSLTPIPWTNSGFCLSAEINPAKHPYHAAGLYYLQDPSAMAVAEILDPQPGERVLDLAAAPGGKTTHMSSMMQNQGLLIANDVHPRRVRALMKNVERWGARNVVITNETPARLADHLGAFFDRVLVDAPCSGEGLFRKEPSSRRDWTIKLVENYAKRQDEILYEAARLVRPGGSLVYATCTFAPEENEGVVFRFLKSHPEYALLKPSIVVGFDLGRPEWISKDARTLDLNRTIRIWPHRTVGEGHFIAHLVKQKDEVENLIEESQLKQLWQSSALSQNALNYYREFWDENLSIPLIKDRIALVGSFLYRLPDGLPDLRGLSVLHWGWWLGTMKKKRFEPSPAFVMAMESSDFRNVLSFPAEGASVFKYLRGEVFPSQGPDGWVAVCVQDFPLGWGRRVQGRLRGRFPKWLRLM